MANRIKPVLSHGPATTRGKAEEEATTSRRAIFGDPDVCSICVSGVVERAIAEPAVLPVPGIGCGQKKENCHPPPAERAHNRCQEGTPPRKAHGGSVSG
ncbi:ABC transporter permease [Anopheles sinensis]|uniref:ABC transporter permease n=1 Tax=Anopheles sinensis TaxID=74873 RepID=A0A084W4D9_ANOSI|nr:ABC transporter permease [Anopheles sinensis]